MPAEGFKGQVASGGSLLGRAGKWGACGWAVVQLDCDEEMGAPAWDVRLDGGRIGGPANHQEGGATVSRKSLYPSRCMSTTEESQMGYGEEKENAWIRQLAMRTCGSKSGRIAVGVRKALLHAGGRLQGPCCHRRLTAGKSGKMERHLPLLA